LARDLGHVLHLFAPELAAPGGAGVDATAGVLPPLIGVPLARPDAVRAALLDNVAVEAGRQGARVTLLTPHTLGGVLTAEGPPFGVESHRVDDGPSALVRGAEEALRRAPLRDPVLVLAAYPASWLQKGAECAALLRWSLVFVRPDAASLREASSALEAIAAQVSGARLGVSVYGVRSIVEARDCFEHLALGVERRVGCALTSYGVLVDDVHVSRSIVTGRPVGLANPHTPSARAFADVARLLLGDV
jgi:hypothetical protein